MENHFLQVGYCLVFKYYGKLQFSVRIFDTNACEAHVELCCCSSDDCGSKGEEDTERTKGKTSPDYGNLCGHQANGHSAQESSSEVDELDTRNFQETSSHVKFCKHAIHKVESKWEKIRNDIPFFREVHFCSYSFFSHLNKVRIVMQVEVDH